ncbi:MAG: phosphoribosylamine--glycine ligase, partial [Kiloniellales bacterium]
MRILLVGGGGREHALAWTLAGSPLCDKLFCAPGNAGIARDAECVAVGSDESERLVAFAREQKLDLVVVGPEAPLVAGLVDRLEATGIRAFGPSAAAARLEASKGFTKDLCRRFGIPTAGYRRFTELKPAKRYIRELAAAAGGRLVVKADGLAAGKGV